MVAVVDAVDYVGLLTIRLAMLLLQRTQAEVFLLLAPWWWLLQSHPMWSWWSMLWRSQWKTTWSPRVTGFFEAVAQCCSIDFDVVVAAALVAAGLVVAVVVALAAPESLALVASAGRWVGNLETCRRRRTAAASWGPLWDPRRAVRCRRRRP